MDEQALTPLAEAAGPKAANSRTYPQSWVDRFMDAVERLPIPYWATYLVLFLVDSFLGLALAWVDGWLEFPQFDILVLGLPMWRWLPLALMTRLDHVSLNVLDEFRPLLRASEEGFMALKAEFAGMPARPVLFVSLLLGLVTSVPIVVFYLPFVLRTLGAGTSFGLLLLISMLPSFAIAFAFYYHTIRQLRLVNRVVKTAERFDLFQLDSVYAFSRLTAQSGIAWVILLSFSLLVNPFRDNELSLFLLVTQLMLAAAAFILPLWGMHQRLLAQKRDLASEVNRRISSTMHLLHRYIDEDDLELAGKVNGVLDSLVSELQIVSRIPTWPWRPQTLTGFLSALVLPIVIFLIQLVIQRLLGS